VSGVYAPGNSTTEVLGASEVFTGQSDVVKDYSSAAINIYADVALAPGGFEVQFSSDGNNWWVERRLDVAAGQTYSLRIDIVARFLRVVATNGATAQGAFRLQTIYHVEALHAEDRDFDTRVGRGEVPGWSSYVWRAHNPDVDSAAAEDVVEWGGTVQYLTSEETVDVVSTSTEDDVGQTGGTAVLVDGVDGNGDPVSEVVTLDGTNPVTTTQAFYRINQMTVAACGSAGSNVGTIQATATTSGYVMGEIDPTDGISHSGIYTVPNGKRATFTGADINIVRPSGQSPIVRLKIFVRLSGSSPWLNLFEIDMDTDKATFLSFEAHNRASFGAGVDARLQATTANNDTDVRARLYLELGPAL
jgi:hypothetical protein